MAGPPDEKAGLDATVLAPSQAGLPKSAGEPQDLSGTRLKHFEVVRLLGRGGMGAVYLGHDTSLDRPVALKVLAPEIGRDPELVARFVREARAQARLRHPNVTQIYFIGEDAGVHFFAMEYVEGAPLEARIKEEGRLPWPEALEHTIAAARGLRAAFQQGFIHRDVKPSNLLLEPDGQLKIADFGLAKSLKGDVELTREGVILGSPLYMAPEQGRSEAVDHRSDIYSLGCALYHMLTGEPPFTGPSPVTVITKHVTDRARPVRATASDAPAAVERVVARMMAKDPAARYASYDELLAALEDARPRREYSGFWIRAIAAGIDGVLLLVLGAFIGWWVLPAAALYYVTAHRFLGATVGKLIMRLRVTDLEGDLISWKAAALRFLTFAWGPGVWLLTAVVIYQLEKNTRIAFRLRTLTAEDLVRPAVILGLLGLTFLGYLGGLMLAAFHPQKRALHDLAARTQVTHRPSR